MTLKDPIDINEIKNNIHPFYQNIIYFDKIDSTSTYMKNNTFQQGDIVIAEYQTKGKGRNGRSFHSPKDKGIYLSFIIKPDLSIYESLKITACLSVSLVKTIQKHYALKPQIKWVNDIIIDDLKVAGILCEATLLPHSNQIDQMIIGVGINVHHYDMPDTLKSIAGCLEDHTDVFIERQKIIIDFLNIFYDDYSKLSTLSFLDDYRKYSYILHQEITVFENNTAYPAYVSSINDDGTLTIITNNEVKILQSGEVSIRKINHQQRT